MQELLAQPDAFDFAKNNVYLLTIFVGNYKKIDIGERILPRLIEFYQWLHSNLAFQLSHMQAEQLTVKQVIDTVSKHCTPELKKYLQELYKEVRGVLGK